ncbi:hypothetical protein KCU77_g10138, partial [Aureobasidium melanogenum]
MERSGLKTRFRHRAATSRVRDYAWLRTPYVRRQKQNRDCKTYSSRDSHVVTHRSTNLPFNCLCMAERTGCPVFS